MQEGLMRETCEQCLIQCWALGSQNGIPTWDLGWDLGSQRGIQQMGWDLGTLQGSLVSNPYTKSEGRRPSQWSHPHILGKALEKGIPSTKYHLGSQMGSHRFLGSQHCYICLRPPGKWFWTILHATSILLPAKCAPSLNLNVALKSQEYNCWCRLIFRGSVFET